MQLSGVTHFITRSPWSKSWVPVAAGVAVGLLASNYRRRTLSDTPYQSPLTTVLPSLSDDAIRTLPYPPDAYPGARNVNTPLGSIRVYEWGPTDGKKVLLVHGISTPCISMVQIASRLVESGCRVMVFDLFGRGFSGAPNPKNHPHDASLYITQILYVLASSSVPWTGASSGGFTIVGYSFGGGVAATFISYFPHLVSNLVLLAPGGIMREHHISWTSHILYNNGGLIPNSFVRWAVGRRLKPAPEKPPLVRPTNESNPDEDDIGTAEIPSTPGNPQSRKEPVIGVESVSHGPNLVPSRPSINAAKATDWQIKHHEGFLSVFISAIQHGPITKQHETWRKVRHAFEADGREKRVLLVLGHTDSIVKADEVGPDALEIFGEELLQTEVLDAGHDLPMKNGEEIADFITGLPNMGKS
ncbi:alpha/beta-hydrolase [Eremomyces bilateralis CBS 781.70]|uniref:Alpha/beta-hydrolase n=1 Tax=Eremomyces bilateralis CBS 781.70 TaxID=1392243 RepID=A0A6G1FXA4_9PEZI|nr:alpha/beta-hydrolase [Eremomyces bilateralis CBS 781.70]KAF1810467.1 alpha/beta-hydrolase [Eremomyces bilateralis CBS 781.70]